jgi:hypothetical protein
MKSPSFEGSDHLIDRGGGNHEVLRNVRLRRRDAVALKILLDELEVFGLATRATRSTLGESLDAHVG